MEMCLGRFTCGVHFFQVALGDLKEIYSLLIPAKKREFVGGDGRVRTVDVREC
jgi:hypothetical protein